MKKLLFIIALGSVTLLSADAQNDRNRVSDNRYYEQKQRNQAADRQYYDQRQRTMQNNQNQDYLKQRNQQYQQQQQQQTQQTLQHKKDVSFEIGKRPREASTQDNYYIDSKEWGGGQGDYYDDNYSDRDINGKVDDVVGSGWFSKGFENVSYDVNNGNVTIRGSVDTIENKNKIEDKIRNIDGVKSVTNDLKIRKENSSAYSESQLQSSEKKFPRDSATTIQDRELNARIRDKLSNGWLWDSYETLVIKTDNGIVILSGMVDKPEDVQKVTDRLKEVEGVKSIKNQLTVKDRR